METSAGTAVHMETPFATFDVRPEKALDSRLAFIPLYPGALPQNPSGAQEVSEVHIRGRAFQEISTTYWTPDDQQRVWEFYRQQLPDWPRNLDGAQGRELISHRPDFVLLVRVRKGQDRTVIETCIKPSGYPNFR